MSVADALHVMRDPEAVAELAECASGVVPECSTGMEQLISSYVASPLARFHRDFYSTGPDPPDTWPETYDRTDLGALPPCARFILEHPNDPLIKPSGMRRIVAVFLSLGWHPRHIAGLIQSKFERDYAWDGKNHPAPRVINTDEDAAYPPAIVQLKAEAALEEDCHHRPVKYLEQCSGTGSSGDQAPGQSQPTFSVLLGSLAHEEPVTRPSI